VSNISRSVPAPAMRDAQFDLPDGQDFGYHPSPMEPVVVAIV